MKNSIEELREFASKGNVEAQYELGIMLLSDAETYWVSPRPIQYRKQNLITVPK